MAGESVQRMKVKTTKELTEEVKQLKEVNDKLVTKLNSFEDVIKELEDKLKQTKDDVYELKEKCDLKKANKKFDCISCEESFSNKSSMKKHNAEHHGKIVKCEQCNESFKELWMLEIHLKSHPNKEMFECEMCQKTFQIKWRLKKHKEMHTDPSIKKCHYFNMAKSVHTKKLGACFYMRDQKNATFQTAVRINCAHTVMKLLSLMQLRTNRM